MHSTFVGGIAGTHDPNYQTMAGMGQDCFGNDKAGGGAPVAAPGGPKAPAAGGIYFYFIFVFYNPFSGIAETHDPNYQTLAGMGQDCFGADKAAGGGGGAAAPGAGPKAPAAGVYFILYIHMQSHLF